MDKDNNEIFGVATFPEEEASKPSEPDGSAEDILAWAEALRELESPHVSPDGASRALCIVDVRDEELKATVERLEESRNLFHDTVRKVLRPYLMRKAKGFTEAGTGKRFSKLLSVRCDYNLTIEDVCTLLHGHPIRRCERSFMLVPRDDTVQFLSDTAYDALEVLTRMVPKNHDDTDRCGQWNDL